MDQDTSGGCPYHSELPSAVGGSALTYHDYLKIPELLELQLPQSEPAHHDEMLFIVIHQAYELWFKLVLHEMSQAMGHMRSGKILHAHHFVKRIVAIFHLLVDQIHILETMTPADFLDFRDRLMPASGFQSIQFRELEYAAGLKDERYLSFFENRPDLQAALKARLKAPDLRQCYYEMLIELGFTIPRNAAELELRGTQEEKQPIIAALLPIYQNTSENLPLYLLTESLIEFDEYLGLWREHHVRVVERIIGFKRGTGGSSGVGYLQSTTSKKCFPLLWEVRTHLEKK